MPMVQFYASFMRKYSILHNFKTDSKYAKHAKENQVQSAFPCFECFTAQTCRLLDVSPQYLRLRYRKSPADVVTCGLKSRASLCPSTICSCVILLFNVVKPFFASSTP